MDDELIELLRIYQVFSELTPASHLMDVILNRFFVFLICTILTKEETNEETREETKAEVK